MFLDIECGGIHMTGDSFNSESLQAEAHIDDNGHMIIKGRVMRPMAAFGFQDYTINLNKAETQAIKDLFIPGATQSSRRRI